MKKTKYLAAIALGILSSVFLMSLFVLITEVSSKTMDSEIEAYNHDKKIFNEVKFNYDVLNNSYKWKGLVGEELFTEQINTLKRDRLDGEFSKTIFNHFGGEVKISIDGDELSLNSSKIDSGMSCFQVVTGESISSRKFNEIKKLDTMLSRKIRTNQDNWSHFSVGVDISNNIRKRFFNIDLVDLINKCENNGQPSVDFKLYKISN